jgi:3-hydroxybutyryl-CoA dehydrogenase
MQVVVLTNDELKEELLVQGLKETLTVKWIKNPDEFHQFSDAGAYIDLLFDYNTERIELLKKLPSKPVLINAVNGTLKDLPENFIRINGWATFLKRPLVEAAASEKIREDAEKIMDPLSKKIEWTADVPGFISARVVSMIINEAYFTLAEEVSSKQETDTAMKLGTNYPYGPFEWAEKIGLKNILALLQQLNKEKQRYQPAALLEKEANN